MSTIYCIIDGMTDPSFRTEDYPTLSSMRLDKYLETTPEGYEPESLTCILRLLGVRDIPKKMRGYVEALGANIPVHPDDLILRGSWFSLDGAGRCVAPVKAPKKWELPAGVFYYRLEDYKSLLVLRQHADEIDQLVTTPPYASTGQPAERFRPSGSSTLEELYEMALHKKKCMILWGESVPSRIAPFPERAAVICGTNIVRGIAKLLQMDLLHVKGATGDVDTDLYTKTQETLMAAKRYPFVLLHINGADEAAHRRDEKEKKAFLQKIDAEVLPALLQSGHRILLASDHTSNPINGQHERDRQPLFIGGCERGSDESING